MTRVRAALLVLGGLFGHAVRADDPAWKPAAAVTPIAPPAADTPVSPSVGVELPTKAPPVPLQELNQWLPARRYPTDFPPKPPTAPEPTPLAVALPPAAPAAYHPAVAEPPPVTLPPISPRNEAPAVFPPLRPLPMPPDGALMVSQTPPDVPVPKLPDVKPKPPEPLAAPRPADPPKPMPTPPPPVRMNLAADCPPPAVPTLEPLPGGASVCAPAAVPVRGKVFGSPIINLSRDFSFRELLSQPQYGERRGPEVLSGSEEVTGSASDSFFVQTELLLWWAKRPNIPVLATTSASGTGSGFLGDPDTRTLLGPGRFGPGFQAGFRVRAGAWLDDCGQTGIDGSYFFLGRGRERAVFNGLPVIIRPFFAPNFNAEFGEVVARPNLSTGRLEVEQDSFLWGADANYKCAVCRTCDGGRGWMIGYRHLNLTERLRITEFITATGTLAPDPVGTAVVVGDSFETRNRFHGGQLGYWWTRQADRLELDLRASVALGVTSSRVDIDGFQQRTRPGEQTQAFVGGLLAAGPNLGTFRKSAFSVVPELTANLGYRVSSNLKVYAGYNFLYWSNVLRPGDQIDRTVDVTFVPNPPAGVLPSGQNRPTVPFARSDFWAQGVQLGLEFRW